MLPKKDKDTLLRRRVELLEQIGRLGSITRAAKAVGLSYKAAWQAVEAMNSLGDAPLVARLTGGKGGGGTALTEAGRKLVEAVRRTDASHKALLGGLGRDAKDLGAALGWLRRMSMKTSARNQFFGRVSRVRRGAVNAEVDLAIGGGASVAAVITNASVEELGLAKGAEAFALIKASWVLLAPDGPEPRVSARNRFRGTVERVTRGAVNTEVVLRLPGGQALTAVVTEESCETLRIREAGKAWAFFKASSVILGVQS